ncbi:MAG: hypothetical protein FJW26_08815 [Acidimicrobiia bacterium]|nr:hypothetical protein [Acidimicrobiia bacterium]
MRGTERTRRLPKLRPVAPSMLFWAIGLALGAKAGVTAEKTQGAYVCDFSQLDKRLSLDGAAWVRRFHGVASRPDVKISAADPAYRRYKGEPAGFGHFGMVMKLADGALLTYYSERSAASRSHFGHESSRLVSRRSRDGGRTWDEPLAVASTPRLALPDGTLLYDGQRQPDGTWRLGRSADQGRTVQYDIVAPGPGPAMPKLRMSNGEILFEPGDGPEDPVRHGGYWRVGDWGPTPGPAGGTVRGILISDSKFTRWREIALPQLGYQWDEWWIVETRQPGVLLALCRDQERSNYFYQSMSRDYGRTWDASLPSGVWCSSDPSRPFVMRLADGTLLAINGERANGRMMLTPSFDDGRTWDLSRRIAVCDNPEEWFGGHDFSYPDAAELEGNRLLVRYYTSVVRDVAKQWGVWGNYLDLSYLKRPYRGVCLAPNSAVPAPRAVAQWAFDEMDGEFAHDPVAANYGRVHDAQRVPGRLGGALHLAGRGSSYVEIVDSPSMRVPSEFTLSLSFRAASVEAGQTLLSKRPFYYLGISKGKIVFEIGDPAKKKTTLFYRVESRQSIEPGKWHHVAAATGVHWDGDRKMYVSLDGFPQTAGAAADLVSGTSHSATQEVDGVLQTDVRGWERSWPPSLSFAAEQPQTYAEVAALIDQRPEFGPLFWRVKSRNHIAKNLVIGKDNWANDKVFAGTVDEVALYGEYLLPSSIRKLSQSGYPTDRQGRVTSPAIALPASARWRRFNALAEVPPGTEIEFAILDATTNKVIKTVKDGDTLADLSTPKIRLRARLATTDTSRSPCLQRWEVSWQ